MTYAQLDDRWDDDPKYADWGLEHFGLQGTSITYCNRNGTDGFIPLAHIKKKFGKRAVALAEKLVEQGIWERVEGGYRIVNFLRHNPSKAQIEKKKEGARARKEAWMERNPNAFGTRSGTRSEQDPERNPNAFGTLTESVPSRVGAPAGLLLSPPLPSSPLLSDLPSVGLPDDTRAKDAGSGVRLAPNSGRSLSTLDFMPEVFPFTDHLRLIAEGIFMTAGCPLDPGEVFERFCADRRSKLIRSGNWSEEWRKWCLDAPKYARRDRDRGGSRGQGFRPPEQPTNYKRLDLPETSRK